MSIFGGTKYYVSSASFRLIETPEDPVLTSIMNAISTNTDIAENIINGALIGGMATKVDDMFRYAKSDYFLGLPGGATGNLITLPDTQLADIIKTDIGTTLTVQIDYKTITSLEKDILLMTILTAEYGYDGTTGKITSYPPGMIVEEGDEVYLSSIVFADDDASVDLVYSIYRIESVYVEGNYDVYSGTYSWYYEDQLVLADTFNETITFSSLVHLNEQYAIIKYSLLDINGTVVDDTIWWLYRIASNRYPEFTEQVSTDNDSFLPVVPIRYDNADLTDTAHQDTELYKTSKKLLDKIGVDIDDLADSLNENPNIADIDHAYVMFAINVQDTENEGIEYLTEFFDYLFDIQAVSQNDYIAAVLAGEVPTPNLYYFNDTTLAEDGIINIDEQGLYITITYDYITSVIENEVIGDVGTGIREFSTEDYEVWVPPDWSEYGEDQGQYVTETRGILTLTLQISPTRCKVVTVVNLSHENLIYSRKNKSVVTDIIDLINDADNNGLLIPIHYNIAQTITTLHNNILYQQSLVLIVNTLEKIHTDWYESGFFKMLVVIVGIVLIATGALSELGIWLTNLGYAAFAFVVGLVEALVIGFVIQTGLSIVAASLDSDLLLVISVLVTIYKIFTGDFLSSVSAVVETRNKFELAGAQQDLEDTYTDFELAWEELDEINDLLGNKADYDPLLWAKTVATSEVPNESVEEFKLRTSNEGNTAILNYVENYCDMLLQLPETGEDLLLI